MEHQQVSKAGTWGPTPPRNARRRCGHTSAVFPPERQGSEGSAFRPLQAVERGGGTDFTAHT